jgi:hypothetical protein
MDIRRKILIELKHNPEKSKTKRRSISNYWVDLFPSKKYFGKKKLKIISILPFPESS